MEILGVPHRRSRIQLQEYSTFHGDVGSWFAKFISNQGTTTSNMPCFRMEESKVLCSGVRSDTRGLVLAIPIMLALQVPDSTDPPIWNFPETLTPLTKTLAKKEGVIYDLVGFGLLSQSAQHYTARYALKSPPEVFFFNGMKNGGYTLLEEGASFATHVAGKTQNFPDGYSVETAIYHLRGGSKAQDIFYKIRSELYRKRFKLDVSGLTPDYSTLPKCSYLGNLTELPLEARTWIKNTKTRKLTVEYVSALPTAPVVQSHSKDTADTTLKPPKVPAQLSKPDLATLASTADTPESEEETYHRHDPLSPAASNPSLPDSVWALNCRCGVKGDGNTLYRENDGTTIQCNDCLEWSHVACQRDGRASLLSERKKFICDSCDLQAVLPPRYQKKQRESARKYVVIVYMHLT